ncbi:glycinin G3-like [Cynara cardunculus var. scolymus]|uniref:11-S seed storage protein, plant n=1 Tax=Cynara cardunculus var. scolymus TaxID=59895 RepID=A0A124SCE3_CYNCS|nr:glycinin G3-like [Cynara cardunculus var. scolymus]KVH93490.1 11-S seed storage protein, plant [Cynara cardunculus var. scolymus]
MNLVAEKADQTVYEGEGGAYYTWTPSKSPLLSECKLGAGKLILHPLGFAFPHSFDSSKIAYVLQGSCTVGLVASNSSEETVVVIKKGDAIPLPRGEISWWFNGGNTDLTLIFLCETAKAQVAGEMGYFFLGGAQGMLRGFQSDIVAKVFDLNNKEAEDLISSQPGSLIVKLRKGTEFPNPSEHVKEKVYAAIDTLGADVVVEGGGIINSLTEKEFPVLVGMNLSARFVRLEGKAMLAPSYVADGTGQVIYVAKGSGRIRVVGNEGKPSFDGDVKEGELMVLPQFLAASVIADEGGMELFSVINSSKPTFEQLAGNMSVWKKLSSVVLQSTLNINPELEELFKSKNTKSLMIIPPRN